MEWNGSVFQTYVNQVMCAILLRSYGHFMDIKEILCNICGSDDVILLTIVWST